MRRLRKTVALRQRSARRYPLIVLRFNIVPRNHRRRLSLRTRVRWALFGFGAAAAIALALGALMIDESLEQLIMKSTLQAEVPQFVRQIRSSNIQRLDTAVLRGYFSPQPARAGTGQPTQTDGFLAAHDFDADDCLFICTDPDRPGGWLFGAPRSGPGARRIANRRNVDTAHLGLSPRPKLPATIDTLSTHPLGTRLSHGLESFFWHYASTGPTPPAAIRSLSPGFHEDIWLNDRAYYLLVKDLPGGRLYLAYDTTRLRHRLHWFAGLLLASVVLILLASDQLGRRMADRLTRPLEALARRLKALDPARRGIRVAERQRDPELDQIATAFNAYLARMDDFVHREQAFTQTASHELRTPLTVISGAAELMHAQAANGIHDERALRRIRRATRQMTETVEALLALARAADPDVDPICHIDRLLPDILKAHAYLAEDVPIAVEVGEIEATAVRASPRLLDILIGNLLRNAIQNTHEGRVRVSLHDQRLEVTDTGIGFDPAEVPALLRRGTRGAQALSQGHGLGLYIVSEICARYGWTIALDTHRAGGAHVCVDFAPSSVAALQPTASKP